jgi:hypothetical protein
MAIGDGREDRRPEITIEDLGTVLTGIDHQRAVCAFTGSTHRRRRHGHQVLLLVHAEGGDQAAADCERHWSQPAGPTEKRPNTAFSSRRTHSHNGMRNSATLLISTTSPGKIFLTSVRPARVQAKGGGTP